MLTDVASIDGIEITDAIVPIHAQRIQQGSADNETRLIENATSIIITDICHSSLHVSACVHAGSMQLA